MLPAQLLSLRHGLAKHLGQELTPQVCADIEAQVLRCFSPAVGANALDDLPGVLRDALSLSLDLAVPAPIPWSEAVARVALGQWRAVQHAGAIALVEHGQFMGQPLTTIVAMAGNLDNSPPLVDVIEQQAHKHGSKSIAYLGRRGWARKFPTYKERAVACVKELLP